MNFMDLLSNSKVEFEIYKKILTYIKPHIARMSLMLITLVLTIVISIYYPILW